MRGMVSPMIRMLLVVVLFICVNAQSNITHVYLSLTGDLTNMQLTFSTPFPPLYSVVQYYPTADPSAVSAIDITYEDFNLYVSPFNVSQYIVSVTMYNLQAATDYTYNISLNSTGYPEADASYTFRTLPNDTDPVNILMYGDLGAVGSALWANVTGGLAEWAAQRRMDFIIHYGDLAYNLATDNGTVGELFMQNIVNFSASFPYVVLPGNHEYMDNNTDEAIYRGWFQGQVPLGISSGSPDPVMWHSYDVGEKLHLVGINSEVYCEDPDHLVAQWAWLKKDLAMVQTRETKPWIVVYGHRQMYEDTNTHWHTLVMRLGYQCTDGTWQNCNFSQACLSGINCGFSLEELFQEYDVDLYIAGHLHSYNRMYPIANGTAFEQQANDTYINAVNPVYVISGAAGDQHSGYVEEVFKPNENSTSPSVVKNKDYSLSLLTVYNTTHLRMQQILMNDELLDEFWMVKDISQPPWDIFTSFEVGITAETVCNQ